MLRFRQILLWLNVYKLFIALESINFMLLKLLRCWQIINQWNNRGLVVLKHLKNLTAFCRQFFFCCLCLRLGGLSSRRRRQMVETDQYRPLVPSSSLAKIFLCVGEGWEQIPFAASGHGSTCIHPSSRQVSRA